MPSSILAEKNFKVRPELELIVCAVRAKNAESEERMKTLFGAGVNWSEILACAIQHKLVPLLHERFHEVDPKWFAQDQRERLAERARVERKSNFVFLSEMLRLHGLFEAARIPAIPFKGPALGWLAYPNFALRTCVDLDFVVPQRYIPEASSLLQGHGYIPQFNPIEVQVGKHGPAPGQYAFAPNGDRSFVELHTERTLRYFSRRLNLEEMNSRLIRLEIGGQNILTFSVEDLLVMLCVHGAKHFWERIAWIVDIAQVVTTCEVDWKLLSEIAAERESARVLLLGLYLAHEVIGVDLPRSVLERARGDAQVQWLAGVVLEQYGENADSDIGVFPRAVFRLRSCDGCRQGMRQLFRLSLSPTDSDRQTIRLPGCLSCFYTLVRLFRLLREYGLGLHRHAQPDLAIYERTPPRNY